MIIWFRGNIFLIFVTLILFLPLSEGYAFIPEGSEIISLAVEKIVEPVGITVAQKRKIYYEQKEPEDIKELEATDGIDEQEIIENPEHSAKQKEPLKIELSLLEITEKLWFSYPGKFRSEAVAHSHHMICVEAKGRFVKIIDEFIESKEKALTDLYTDILLFRQPESLTRKLKVSGVNTKRSSIQRLDDIIYFVVGIPPAQDQPSSSLWVEKDTSFPGRYTIRKNGLFVDIFYKDWQKVSKTWYPMQIIIYLDGILFSKIKTERFELEADFEKNFFNVKRLISIFPESEHYKNESGLLKTDSNELEKSITEFKKLYE
jgi:hypothetical protein